MAQSDNHRVTIIDVAREAGVSPRTVSRVMNGNDYVRQATFERVQEVINRFGYRPNRAARSLVYDRSQIVGLVIPDVRNPYFAEVIAGVEQVAQEHDHHVMLFITHSDISLEREFLHILEEHGADGIIINAPKLPGEELQTLLQRQKAAVVIGHDPIGNLAGFVNVNVEAAMHQAVRHMVETGRQHIAYIKPPDDTVYPHRYRYQGFIAAHRELQFELNPAYVVACTPGWEYSFQATRSLLTAHPEIDAIIGYHDLMAFGAIEACDALGRSIPDDISVVGFDDIGFSGLGRLSLTTFKIPRFEVGVQAAQMLFNRMQDVNEPAQLMLETEFIQRNSTLPLTDDTSLSD